MGDDVDMEYLAIDIGASSGKLLKGWLEDGILRTEVVHRFPNSLIKAAGHACWDIAYLEDEVIRGIAKAGSVDFVSIDTWAVDYVLLGSGGEPIAPAVSYRDSRTEDVICPVPKEELYQKALGRPMGPNDRTVDVHVSSIRKKLSSTIGSRLKIESVRGFGYRLTVTDASA